VSHDGISCWWKKYELKFDIGKLKDKAVKRGFNSVITSNMRNNIQLQTEDAEVEDTWEVVKDSVKAAACEVLGPYTKSKAKEWFDEECENVIQARNDAYDLYLARLTKGKKQALDRLNTQVIAGGRKGNT
jgi:glucose-6-phosphate 1-dehydrogenase